MNEYEKQANDFLEKTKTSFKAVFVKHDKYFPDDKDTEKRDIYEITLSRGERSYTFTFGQSINCSVAYYINTNEGRLPFHTKKEALKKYKSGTEIRKNNNFKEPTPYDVLASLTKYHPGEFINFCGDYGYDNDSRKAYEIYERVKKEFEELERLYNAEELEAMQEIN